MQVIESDAEKITTGVPRSKVVVKMLKDDASKDEQMLFFEEVAPFRFVLLDWVWDILCIGSLTHVPAFQHYHSRREAGGLV